MLVKRDAKRRIFGFVEVYEELNTRREFSNMIEQYGNLFRNSLND